MKKLFVLVLMLLAIPVLNLKAKSKDAYILMDQDSGRVLYESLSNERRLTASISKIMTAIVAIENTNIFKTIKVSKEATLAEGSSLYLNVDDEITLLDLLYGLMLRSGNDAALLISQNVFNSEEAFIREMNNYAKKIGMKNSTFENPSGLDDESYNYSTCYDMALLMRYALNNEIFNMITKTKSYIAKTKHNTYQWYNKHKLVQKSNIVKGGKTGYTKKAFRTLVSYAEVDDKKLVVVSLGAADDYNLHLGLFKKGASEFNYQKIIDKGVHKAGFFDLDYYPLVKDGVGLLVKDRAKIRVTFYLKKKPDSNCGYAIVFENNKEILRFPLYPYWPKK